MNLTTNEAQQEYVQGQELKRSPRRGNSKLLYILLYMFLALLSLVLWGSLLYGGYRLADQYINESNAYIDTKVEQIEKQNQKQLEIFIDFQTQLDKVHEELINVQNELLIIKEDLTLTGETLNGTDKTKLALQQRINELNTQLIDLRASISRLEDAAVN